MKTLSLNGTSSTLKHPTRTSVGVPTARPLPASGTDRVTFSSLARKPLFGSSQLGRNSSIGYRVDHTIDYFQMAQTQMALTQQSLTLAAQGDTTSHLTFYADMYDDGVWPAKLNGVVDAMTMTDRPVDVVIKAWGGPMGLKALMSATGRTYMYPNSRLAFKQPEAFMMGTQKMMTNDTQIFAENLRTLEWEIMQKTGIKSRKRVHDDLHKGRLMFPLTALAYGRSGLIDAIIVGDNELLTRTALNKYAKAHAVGDLNVFASDVDSLDKVVAWAREQNHLAAFPRKSIATEPVKLSPSVLDKKDEKKDAPSTSTEFLDALKLLVKGQPDLLARLTNTDDDASDEAEKTFAIHRYKNLEPDTEAKKVTPKRHMMLDEKPSNNGVRLEFQHVPEGYRHVYGRDTSFFGAPFRYNVVSLQSNVLNDIIERKQAQQNAGLNPSNGLIVENSPGGAISVLGDWLNIMSTTDVPFDVVVQGWGTSCGSILLSAATGNRFITPNGHGLIHQLSAKIRDNPDTVEMFNTGFDHQNKLLRYLISKRSGRPMDEVRDDMQSDLDLNAVEMMLYGPNGFADAILVGPDKMLTREAVVDFVAERVNDVTDYANAHFEKRRLADTPPTFKTHKEMDEDPLANPMAVIKTMVKEGKAVAIDSVAGFENSMGDVAGNAEKTMNYYDVTGEPPKPVAAT